MKEGRKKEIKKERKKERKERTGIEVYLCSASSYEPTAVNQMFM